MPQIKDVNFYNLASSKQLGWAPEWFGCSRFDDELAKAIKAFQKSVGLKPDGLCGPMTYRVKYTEMSAGITEITRRLAVAHSLVKPQIACNGIGVPINWSKFVGLNATDNPSLPSSTYVSVDYPRKPTMFAVHWDAALSSKDCKKILSKRNLSVQFSIDNDGTIFQWVDCNNSAQHIGSLNMNSIGVEISNAVYPKYQQHYIDAGFGARPLIKGPNYCHGRNYAPILGFYQVQVDALEALIEAVCGHYGIPLETPQKDGKPIQALYSEAMKKKYRGVIQHFHVDKDKWDACCLNLIPVLQRIKQRKGNNA